MIQKESKKGILHEVSNWIKLLGLIVLVAESVSLIVIVSFDQDIVKLSAYISMIVFLGVIVVGIFIDRNKQFGIAISQKGIAYYERNEATPKMLEDILLSEKMTFMGVSNSSLDEYLADAIKLAQKKYKKIPTKQIDVYFSNDLIGNIWQGKKFLDNVNDSINRICCLLTKGIAREIMPDLKEINFYQNKLKVHIDGSAFLYENIKGSNNEYSIIYVMIDFPSLEPDKKNSYTIRLDSRSEEKHIEYLFKQYSQGLQYLEANKRFLFSYDMDNIWDRSVIQWDKFIKEHHVYKNVMGSLLEFGGVNGKEQIIDLGSGTGRTSAEILQRNKSGFLYLMDSSASMIRFSKDDILQHKRNVDFIVGDALNPHLGENYFEKFDKVISHFSFHSFIEDYNIQEFAANWIRYIKLDGIFLLFIHNSHLKEFNKIKGYEDWEDPLKIKIKEKFESYGLKEFKVSSKKIFTKEEIISGFENVGFKKVEDPQLYEIERTMIDRCSLWQVPAVLDSMIDINKVPANIIDRIFNSIKHELRGVKTMPTYGYFFKFRKTKPISI